MEHPYHNFNTGNNWLDESLENYLIHGLEPGGFLTAVLANDLFRAVGRADHWNKTNIHHIVVEINRVMPAMSFGSYDHVKDWLTDKGSRRSHYVGHLKKQRMMDILSGDYVPFVKEKEDELPF
jgi:hypothetical protein